MTLLDLFILIPLAFVLYRGLSNGLVSEVLGIVGIILAVFLTFRYMDPASDLIRPFFSADAPYIPFVAGSLVFILTLSAVHMAAHLIRRFLEAVHLHWINRLAGGIFGLAKGAILISALLLILAGFNFPSEQARDRSVSYAWIIQAAPMAYDAVASAFPEVENFADTIRETLEEYDPIEHFPQLDN